MPSDVNSLLYVHSRRAAWWRGVVESIPGLEGIKFLCKESSQITHKRPLCVHIAVLSIEWIVSQDQLTMNLSPSKFGPFHRVVLTKIIELSDINIGSTISIGFVRVANTPSNANNKGNHSQF
jgi:hypothetical protein